MGIRSVFTETAKVYWCVLNISISAQSNCAILNRCLSVDYAMKRYRTRGIGHREKSEFDIERDALNDSDIRMICDLYWIDYICFPMQVPRQCNITDLLLAHYGKHITFNDCYVSSD